MAAAFGIAGNRISGAILELQDAYRVMKEAGLPLTAEDKAQFDRYMKQANELASFLNNFEWKNSIDALP